MLEYKYLPLKWENILKLKKIERKKNIIVHFIFTFSLKISYF